MKTNTLKFARPGFVRLLVFMAFIHAALISTASAQSITVVTEEWPPYSQLYQGNITGVVTDVVRATLERSGLDYVIKVLPWARAYHTAKHEENVLIYTIFKLDNRAQHFHWIHIDGLSTEMYLFTTHNREDVHVDDLESAKKFRIGVTRDTSTHHFLQAHGFVDDSNLFPVSNEHQNLQQADDSVRRIDLTTGDRLSISHWLKTYGYPADYLREELLLFKEEFYMAFSIKTDPSIVARVQDAFDEIKKDGTLKYILDQYYHHYGLR